MGSGFYVTVLDEHPRGLFVRRFSFNDTYTPPLLPPLPGIGFFHHGDFGILGVFFESWFRDLGFWDMGICIGIIGIGLVRLTPQRTRWRADRAGFFLHACTHARAASDWVRVD